MFANYDLLTPDNNSTSNVNNKKDNSKVTNNAILQEQYKSHWKKTSLWSEGINRKISTIILGNGSGDKSNQKLVSEMKYLGKLLGFQVGISDMGTNGAWAEDYSIRRADGKVYIPANIGECNDLTFCQNTEKNSNLGEEYAKKFSKSKIVKGKTYLEGGNVLNTILKNGEAGAVIGACSLEYSLKAMGLKDTPQNRVLAKQQIAKDLGIKVKNITFLPQFDFHIDMFYRPLKNGEMTVPDYTEAIKILETTKISGMDKNSKATLIRALKYTNEKYQSYLKTSENELKKKGYKLVRIPCFSVPTNVFHDIDINYANGICGKDKSGKSYIITNKSNYKELDAIITKYYQKAGVDHVYFVSTQEYLKHLGGIDCRTQEF